MQDGCASKQGERPRDRLQGHHTSCADHQACRSNVLTFGMSPGEASFRTTSLASGRTALRAQSASFVLSCWVLTGFVGVVEDDSSRTPVAQPYRHVARCWVARNALHVRLQSPARGVADDGRLGYPNSAAAMR